MNDRNPSPPALDEEPKGSSLASSLREEIIEDMRELRRFRRRLIFLAQFAFWVSLGLFFAGAIVAMKETGWDFGKRWQVVYLMFPGVIAAFIITSAVRSVFRRDGESESHWQAIVDRIKDD
ncbi:MAG: hypothetical protein D6771_03320 [Zetaproteobacteria bacterium]|nr:MAG: hypothetical protein D6771_03320 [Zetaproteobacteria bacterium]